MTTIIMSFCPTCGAPHKLFAVCKTCGTEAIRGTMDEMLAKQAARTAATPAPVAAPVSGDEYARACREAASEARKASLAKTATPAARFARSTRPQWQRACTCGHCMTCIGE